MAHVVSRHFASPYVVSVLVGSLIGFSLGLASAQDRGAGQLDTACAARCTANGYETAFCSDVCWVPDRGASAKADNLDWKCFQSCRQRGGRADYCVTSCPRR